MFKATKEFTLGELVILEGQEVKNPTERMFELGLVVEVKEAAAPAPKAEKPKKEKKVEEVKVEETVEETILTEDSATVEVKAE